jgi:hypothetical protein
MGQEMYGLGNVYRKGHMIAEDQIKTTGAGIDMVTDHMIVMVVTLDTGMGIDSCTRELQNEPWIIQNG